MAGIFLFRCSHYCFVQIEARGWLLQANFSNRWAIKEVDHEQEAYCNADGSTKATARNDRKKFDAFADKHGGGTARGAIHLYMSVSDSLGTETDHWGWCL